MSIAGAAPGPPGPPRVRLNLELGFRNAGFRVNGVYRRREKGSKPGEVGEWHCEVGWGAREGVGEGSTGCRGCKVSKREGERNVSTEQARKRSVQ